MALQKFFFLFFLAFLTNTASYTARTLYEFIQPKGYLSPLKQSDPDLMFWIRPDTPEWALPFIRSALNRWHQQVPYFTFTETNLQDLADIQITYEYELKHAGCLKAFEKGVLAHANPPPGTQLHINHQVQWYQGDGASKDGDINLESVVMHEVGHLLGLGDDEKHIDSLMYFEYNSYSRFPKLWLSEDDFEGIKALYNLN